MLIISRMYTNRFPNAIFDTNCGSQEECVVMGRGGGVVTQNKQMTRRSGNPILKKRENKQSEKQFEEQRTGISFGELQPATCI
jgi:hypothetical protein